MDYAPLVVVGGVVAGAFTVFYRIAYRGPERGFGRYATSAFLLLVVASITAILAVTKSIDSGHVAAIMTAIIGFAGGLFAGGLGSNRAQKDES